MKGVSIKINIDNLDSYIDELDTQKSLFGSSKYQYLDSNDCKGKTQDKLIEIDKSYKILDDSLYGLMKNVNKFFKCAKDGFVKSDEYLSKKMKKLG